MDDPTNFSHDRGAPILFLDCYKSMSDSDIFEDSLSYLWVSLVLCVMVDLQKDHLIIITF